MLKKNKLEYLQILRGIAASSVVFFHSVDHFSRIKTIRDSYFINNYDIFHVGAAGVDLFFCISGFIMIYIHRKEFGQLNSALKFMKKRIMRIVPVYWILTTLAVIILIFAPELSFHKRKLDWSWIILSYFFIPSINESGNRYPVLGLGWTLNFEMYFYVCFAGCLLFQRKYFIPLISLYFIISISLGKIFQFVHPFFLMITSPMLIEFLFGCLIAEAHIKNFELKTYQCIILIIFSLILLYISSLWPDKTSVGFYRVILWGIPASMLLLSFTLSSKIKEVNWSQFLIKIGDASYSIYLIQVFSIPAIAKLINQNGVSNYRDSSILVVFIGTIIFGIIFHYLIEKKFMEWRGYSIIKK